MHNAVGIYAADRKREETFVTCVRRVPRRASSMKRMNVRRFETLLLHEADVSPADD